MSEYKYGVVFDAKTGKFISDVKGAERSIYSFGRTTKGASSVNGQFAKSLNNTNTALASTTKHAKSAHNGLDDMIKSMAIMSAVMGTIGLGTKLVTDLATFQDLRVRLQGMSDGAADYAEKEQFLIDLAQRHHKELSGLADGYAGLSVMVKENIVNDDQARKMLEGLSNAASATGADAANLKQVFYGLNQALGQGTVQAQELNQVVEPMPGLLTKIARAAGEETGSAFRKLIKTGKVTSEMFGKYLVKALKEYDGAAAKTGDNINAKFADISTAYLLLAKNLEQPINSALLPVLDGLSSGLTALGENAETVSTIVFAGFALAMAHATKAISNKTLATANGLITDRLAAKTTLVQAKAEEKLAIAYKSSAVGSAQNTIADKRLTASRIALTSATRATSISQKTLALTMAALGGPAGVLLLSVWGFFELADAMSKTETGSEQLNRSLGKTTKNIKEMTRAEQLSTLGAYKKLIKEKNTSIAELDDIAKKQANQAKNTSGKNSENAAGIRAWSSSGAADKAREELEALKNSLSDVEGALFDAGMEKIKWNSVIVDGEEVSEVGKGDGKQDKKILETFNNQRNALIQRLALLGKTNELAKAEFSTTFGKYKDLLPAQKAEIIALAKTIDFKNQSNAADVAANQQAKQLSNTAQNYAETLQRKISLSGQINEVDRLNYELEHGSLMGINDLLKKQLLIKAQLADQAISDAEKQLPFWEQMKENIQQTSGDFDAMWGRSFSNFAQGIGDATSTAIMEGQNFGDTMKVFAKSMVKEVISGLVQIGVKKLALAAIEKVINKGTALSAGGLMVANAGATSMQAGLAAFASTAAIPIVGPALAPGAMAAALAVTGPMVGAIASSAGAMAGMAHDGIDEIPREGTWLLDKGERVVDSRTNQDLKQALNGGGLGGGTSISVSNVFESGADSANFGEEFFDQQREAVYNAVVQAKADRGEEF